MSWYVNSVNEMPCCDSSRVCTLCDNLYRELITPCRSYAPFTRQHGVNTRIDSYSAQKMQKAHPFEPFQVVQNLRGFYTIWERVEPLCSILNSTLEELVDTSHEMVDVILHDIGL